jgi:hypothetical protein
MFAINAGKNGWKDIMNASIVMARTSKERGLLRVEKG